MPQTLSNFIKMKSNNYQSLADKAIESAIKWAKEDSLKENGGYFTDNYMNMLRDFNFFVEMKYGSPHDFVVIKEESIRNRYDEVFYILTEANQRGLFTAQTNELAIALLVIADNLPGFEEEGEQTEKQHLAADVENIKANHSGEPNKPRFNRRRKYRV